jgi:ferritin-like metal-binding protein YciE
MAQDTLETLYIDYLKCLYDAEHQILKTLPRMSETALSPDLKSAFESHLRQTAAQIERLGKVFQNMEMNPCSKQCLGMKGLLQEGNQVITEEMEPMIRDTALIGAAKKMTHYEVSAYENAVSYARLWGDDEAVSLFKQTIHEEMQMDDILTVIAGYGIHDAALIRLL